MGDGELFLLTVVDVALGVMVLVFILGIVTAVIWQVQRWRSPHAELDQDMRQFLDQPHSSV